jgi:hypothetical protein
VLKKKISANFQRIIELLTQKLSLSSKKYWFGIRDPGSGKTYSGSRIRIRNTGFCIRERPMGICSSDGFGRVDFKCRVCLWLLALMYHCLSLF